MPDHATLISTPANELTDLPRVRTNYFEQVPYVQVLSDAGRPLLDLTRTDAVNLAVLLTVEAGQGLNRGPARGLSGGWSLTVNREHGEGSL